MLQQIRIELFGRRLLVAATCLFAGWIALQAPFLCAQEDGADDKPARPKTEMLLPETTVGYVEIRNIQEFIEKFNEGAMGKMLANEKIKGLVNELYEQGNEAFEDNAPIDMTLDEIRSLPSGEITIAAVAPRLKDMCFIFIIEVDDKNKAVDKAIDTIRGLAEDDGAEFEVAENEDVEFQTIVGNNSRVTYFRRDGLLVASNNEDELKDLLTRWNGLEVEKVRPLAENRKFATVMNRCKSPRDLPAEFRFFIDPIEFAKSATRGEPGAQFAIAFLPALGLDGVLAAGGSVIMFEDDFESVMHGHLLLASPRKGILDMIALKPGNFEPESWMPADAARYITSVWDIPKFVSELEKLVDLTSGEGTFRTGLETQINERLGIDLEADLLETLTGRVTNASWVEPPARFNSEVNVFSFELKDKDTFKETIESLMDFAAEQADVDSMFDVTNHDGTDYWVLSQEFNDRQEERQEEARERTREWRREAAEQEGREFNDDDEDGNGIDLEIRPMEPAFAIIGDYFLIGSPGFIEHAIDVQLGKDAALANDEEYSKIMRKMTSLLKTDMPSVTMFTRPSVLMKNLWEVAQADNTMQLFDNENVLDNQYVQGVRRAMEENPLPDFEEIEGLFQPQGGFITSDDTGFHFLFFQMKVQEDDENADSDVEK